MDEGFMKKIVPPTECPACNSKLVWKNDQLYCVASSCGAKIQKRLEHWAKLLKIKGLGPASIKKLDVRSIVQLYELEEDDFVSVLGSKIGQKVFAEVVNSRQAPLNLVLPAFGISLIGQSATEKLSSVISQLDELTEEKAREAGLGPKAVINLMSWFETYYLSARTMLPFDFKFQEKAKALTATKGVVCITGKLKSFKTKAEATKALTEAGYQVKPSVTKQVTILVNESGIESAKTQKAREAGVSVITTLSQLLGE